MRVKCVTELTGNNNAKRLYFLSKEKKSQNQKTQALSKYLGALYDNINMTMQEQI